MRAVIKLGGTLLDRPEKLGSIARQLKEVAARHEVAVVHGGGKQVTRFLDDRGLASKFVNGLRVSDAAVIEAVTMVIAGSINKQLVSALIASGCPALGLSGVDGSLTRAEQLSPELQFVGRPSSSDGRLLRLLVNAGYLPVVACIAGDDSGNIFNVNADRMAVSCAAGWQAERLIFLTDVPGVKDASGSVLQTLDQERIRQLISSGVAQGGMQAKLEAATAALQAGLRVTIAMGSERDIATRLMNEEPGGTELIPESASALTSRARLR